MVNLSSSKAKKNEWPNVFGISTNSIWLCRTKLLSTELYRMSENPPVRIPHTPMLITFLQPVSLLSSTTRPLVPSCVPFNLSSLAPLPICWQKSFWSTMPATGRFCNGLWKSMWEVCGQPKWRYKGRNLGWVSSRLDYWGPKILMILYLWEWRSHYHLMVLFSTTAPFYFYRSFLRLHCLLYSFQELPRLFYFYFQFFARYPFLEPL